MTRIPLEGGTVFNPNYDGYNENEKGDWRVSPRDKGYGKPIKWPERSTPILSGAELKELAELRKRSPREFEEYARLKDKE